MYQPGHHPINRKKLNVAEWGKISLLQQKITWYKVAILEGKLIVIPALGNPIKVKFELIVEVPLFPRMSHSFVLGSRMADFVPRDRLMLKVHSGSNQASNFKIGH